MSKGPIGTSFPKRREHRLQRVHSAIAGSLYRASPSWLRQSPRLKSRQKKRGEFATPPRAAPQSGLQRARGDCGAPAGTPGSLTYVRVAEGVLGVAGRARARLGTPVPQAPAAQEHDEPEPRSHCGCRCRSCRSPLQSCGARRRRGRCSRSSPTRPCRATSASGVLPTESPAGRDGSRRGCLGAGARLRGPALSLGQGAGAGAGAGGVGAGEAV